MKQKQDDNYTALFAAIWKQAVYDDYRKEKARLFFDITESLFPLLVIRGKEKRDTFSKIAGILKNNDDVKHLEQIYNENLERLEELVQQAVYRESQKYPYNRGIKDKQYEAQYRQLRADIKDEYNLKIAG